MILFFLSPFILNIYNARYLMYATSLSIIAVGGYVGALTYPFSSSIISKGKQHMVAWISLSGIILNIILNVILIPTSILGIRLGSLGVEGATISYTAANFLVYFLYKEYFRKINETRTRSTTLIHIVVAFPSGVLLILSAIYIRPYSFIILFPVILLSLFIYLMMSLFFKEITASQIKLLIRNVIPRKNQ
jgi:O-antigen/teichoic acid export membrane protein